MRAKDGQSFVCADIPGLIEGASEGKGLGHQFLRHIERTALLAHMVDVTGGFEGRDPVDDYRIINRELEAYAPELSRRPMVVLANKCDMPNTEEKVEELRRMAEADGHQFFAISTVTGQNLDELVVWCASTVAELRQELALTEPTEDRSEFWESLRKRRDNHLTIEREERHVWRVSGTAIERMVIQTDWDNDEAVAYLQHRFDRIGLDDQLIKAGARNGDEIRILGFAFSFEAAGAQEIDEEEVPSDATSLSETLDDSDVTVVDKD